LASMASMTRGTEIATTLRAAGCVFAEDEAQVLIDSATHPDELSRMVEQRVKGLPLEHIVGWADFCGKRMAVGPGVFVPRRRTEFLVLQAAMIAELLPTEPPAVVVDLCCGSGAIGAALGDQLESCELHAVDVDAAAVACARRNVEPRGGRVHHGDLYGALPRELRGKVDVLLANAPYVPTEYIGMMPPEARLHEPMVALDGGADGLDVQRRVAHGAAEWLAPGGTLLMETSRQQAAETAALLTGSGLLASMVSDEELGATVVLGVVRSISF
jgi:release factor glutamine methyltransferase